MAVSEDLQWREIEVDVLWGKMRGKIVDLQGGGRRVVCLHGWMDNANSFDLLVPHLPGGLTLLSLDLPGHGHSDHLPLGGHYDVYIHVHNVHKVLTHLGWTRAIFVNHSLGCMVATCLAAMYPECVEALVNIDFVSNVNTRVNTVQNEKDSLDLLTAAEKKSFQDPPVYSREVVLKKMVEGRRQNEGSGHYPIDERIAEVLFPRAVKLAPDGQGYVWRHDVKLKSKFTRPFGYENLLRAFRVITCPVLLVRGSEGVSKSLKEDMFREIVSAYKSNGCSFDYVVIDDMHHLHLTSPIQVAEAINSFFRKIDTGMCKETNSASRL